MMYYKKNDIKEYKCFGRIKKESEFVQIQNFLNLFKLNFLIL